jgi:hypothetical protein
MLSTIAAWRDSATVYHHALAWSLLITLVVFTDVGAGFNQLIDPAVLTVIAVGYLSSRLTDRVGVVALSVLWPTLGVRAECRVPALREPNRCQAPYRSGTQPHARLEAYLAAVRQFRDGDVASARRSLLTLPRADMLEAVGELRRAVKVGDLREVVRNIEAAAVLHTEVALRESLPLDGRVFHQDIARDLLFHTGAPVSRQLQKQWYLAVVAFWQREARVNEVMMVMAGAVHDFRGDSEVLVAQGAFWELLAAWPGSEGSQLPVNGAVAPITSPLTTLGHNDYAILEDRRTILGQCRRVYSLALRAGESDEARLRLGLVLLQLDQAAEVLSAVGPLLERASSGRSRYLAALTASSAAAALQRWPEAARFARAAIDDYPACQTPRIALSRALKGAGDEEASRRCITELLASDGCGEDPWWSRYEGAAWRLDSMLAAMESEARR